MRLTEPIQGCVITSKDFADRICEKRFGCGWEWAKYHEVSHDNFYGHGNIGITPWVINYFAWPLYERFWVYHFHHQPNCWHGPEI